MDIAINQQMHNTRSLLACGEGESEGFPPPSPPPKKIFFLSDELAMGKNYMCLCGISKG